MPVLTVPAPLRKQLGEEAADSLVVFINAANDELRDDVIEIVEERFERRLAETEARLDKRITEEVARLRVEFTERLSSELSGLRVEFTERLSSELSGLRVDLSKELAALRVEIANSRSDLIRWMFGFWVGLVAVIVALFALLR